MSTDISAILSGDTVVERAITKMLFSHSDATFFAYFLVRMAMIQDKHPPQSMGMGVRVLDGVFQLTYDLKRLDDSGVGDIDSVVWISIHECWHWVLNHNWRELEFFNKDEKLMRSWHVAWNCAADLEIHEHHQPDGKLKGKVCKVGEEGPFKDFPPNATAEEYMRLIMDNNIIHKNIGSTGGDGGTGDDGEQGRYKAQIQDNEVVITDTKTGKEYRFKISNQDPPKESDDAGMGREMLKQQLAEALKEARPVMGSGSNGLMSTVEKLLSAPCIDWRHRFQNLVGKCARFSWRGSWRRFSRRMGEGFRGKVKDRGLRIVVAVDTSGSISTDILSAFANEIETIRKVRSVKSLWVVECDDTIHRAYELKPGERLSPEFKGRGGTDFRPVFNHIKETKLDIDMLIYLTDSYGDYPTSKPQQYPVIWAITNSENMSRPPWGDIVGLPATDKKGK